MFTTHIFVGRPKCQRLTSSQLKRQHSAEPLAAPSPKEQDRKVSPTATTPTTTDTPITTLFLTNGSQAEASSSQSPVASALPLDIASSDTAVASPFKKQRASIPGFESGVRKSLGLDAIASASRRESEGNAATALSSIGGAWPSSSLPEPVATKFQAGPPAKADNETEMEEEL